MRSGLLTAAVVLASVPVLAVPQEPKKSDKDNKTITVTGCVEGGYLRVHEMDTKGSYTERYRLAGSKSLLKELASQQHGHLLEVTGRVVDAPGTEHAGHTSQVGKKTTIYTGAKDVPTIPTGDTTSALISFANGATSTIATTLKTPFVWRLAVYGADMWARAGREIAQELEHVGGALSHFRHERQIGVVRVSEQLRFLVPQLEDARDDRRVVPLRRRAEVGRERCGCAMHQRAQSAVLRVLDDGHVARVAQRQQVAVATGGFRRQGVDVAGRVVLYDHPGDCLEHTPRPVV